MLPKKYLQRIFKIKIGYNLWKILMSDNQEASKNYKDTVFLPTTAFPMRGGLPQKEPEIIARWKQLDLYKRLRQARTGREKFILHDGPPYANGNLHIGHALNKILKDVINRSQSMMGKDANYVPGWDCHGLPIEWKIEEQYRKQGKDKDEVPIEEFREECRVFAAHWMDVHGWMCIDMHRYAWICMDGCA